MRKDIIEYEKRLQEDRQRLLQLVEMCEGENEEFVRDKLKFFQVELNHLNYQYELLKKQAEVSQEQITTPPVQTTPQPQVQVTQTVPQPRQKNLEKAVGSSLMGILASGLIFISMILFATVFLPYMTDAVKMAGCYLLSFGIIGFSLYKLQKKQENKFFLILSGCGVGALYITLLLTNLYFKYISDTVLFVLIAVWVGFVCYLSKKKSKVFHIIGQLGVTISVVFGCSLCSNTDNFAKFVTLTLFYAVTFGVLYATRWEKELVANKTTNIFGIINLSMFYFAALSIIDEGNGFYYIILIVMALVHLGLLFVAKWERAWMSYGVFVSAYGYLAAFLTAAFLESDNVQGVVIYLTAAVLILLLEWKEKNSKCGKIYGQICLLFPAWIGLAMNDALHEHGLVWLMVMPLLVLGFFCKNVVGKYSGLVFLWIYFLCSINWVEHFVVGLVAMVLVYGLLWKKKECYSLGFKVILHLLGIMFIEVVVDRFLRGAGMEIGTRGALIFILEAIYNMGMAKSCFAKNLRTGNAENPVLYNVLNLFLMAGGIMEIGENTVLHIPVILVTLVIFLFNSKNLLDKYQNVFVGIYVGLKFTVLLVAILNSFNTINYVVSSACILFAVMCIVLGFVKQYKSLRIYGLLLSMLSVFKLVMVDIRYENTLGNAISFFVSGILCFAISMIYSYIDKRVKSTII